MATEENQDLTKSMTWLRASALLGAAFWFVEQWILPPRSPEVNLTSRLVLLAILVFTPLALSLVIDTYAGSQPLFLFLARILQPFAALLAAISFLFPEGKTAALLASGWLLFTGIVAFVGLERLLKRIPGYDQACVTAAMLYLPVGGAWLVASRLGFRPLGFGATIVLLTAMHFHFAGFAAPIIASEVGRRLKSGNGTVVRIYRPIVIGIIIGTPLLAAGITLSPILEVIAAGVLAISLMGLSILNVSSIIPNVANGLSRTLLLISSVSIFAAMIFAAAYSIGSASGHPIISIPQMVESHGIANAFGFTLCGLLAFTIIQSEEQAVGGSNDYHFISKWRVQATIYEVADILKDSSALTDWWPSVYLELEELEPGDNDGVGRVVRVVTKGWLPYSISWKFNGMESRYPYGSSLRAFGDFDGTGVWTFEPDGEWVNLTYDWRIKGEKPFFKTFSFILRPVFGANHRWAMARGEESLILEIARRRAATPEEAARIPNPPGPTFPHSRQYAKRVKSAQ